MVAWREILSYLKLLLFVAYVMIIILYISELKLDCFCHETNKNFIVDVELHPTCSNVIADDV